MPRPDRTVDRRVTLYARAELPEPAAKRRDAVIAELAHVGSSDAIDGFDVVYWAKRVPAVDATVARERALVREFREWAERRGVTLEPCFETRLCYGQASGERRRELVLPALCLAIYEGEELVDLAPHRDDEDVVTVGALLDKLDGDSPGPGKNERAMPTAD